MMHHVKFDSRNATATRVSDVNSLKGGERPLRLLQPHVAWLADSGRCQVGARRGQRPRPGSERRKSRYAGPLCRAGSWTGLNIPPPDFQTLQQRLLPATYLVATGKLHTAYFGAHVSGRSFDSSFSTSSLTFVVTGYPHSQGDRLLSVARAAPTTATASLRLLRGAYPDVYPERNFIGHSTS